jgi:uncharacterized protein (TIGR02246 family)
LAKRHFEIGRFQNLKNRFVLLARSTSIATIALLLTAVISACSLTTDRGGSMQTQTNLEADLRAIDALNQRDVQFALANDAAMMMSQWTDDFVLLPAAGPILRGRSAIAESFRGVESPEIIESVLDIQEVKVLGDHAFEWGTYHYSVRPPAGGEPVRTSGKLMRILQRQPDGSWKMYRGIATVDPPTR